MSEEESRIDELRARSCVNEAKSLDRIGEEERADRFWRAAEDRYVEMGLDPQWFDPGALGEALDGPNRAMHTRDIVDSPLVEVTYRPLNSSIEGIVAHRSDVVEDLR